MSIGEAQQELVDFGNSVEAYVQEAAAAADQERFTSLPDRLMRANGLAQELGQLLSGVMVDLDEYTGVMLPYTMADISNNPNCIPEQLERRAKSIAEQHGSESMAQLPDVIHRMGGKLADLPRIGANNVSYITGYTERLQGVAERTEWLAKKFVDSWSVESVTKQMQKGYGKVKRTIAKSGL